MAGEQSEFIQAFLKEDAWPESKQEARNLTLLAHLRKDTKMFDEFMASCIRLYVQTYYTIAEELKENENGGTTTPTLK